MSTSNGGWGFDGGASSASGGHGFGDSRGSGTPGGFGQQGGFSQQGGFGQQGGGFGTAWPDAGSSGFGGQGGGFGTAWPDAGSGGFGGPDGPAPGGREGFGRQPAPFGGGEPDPFGSAGAMDAPAPLERVSTPIGWLYAALGLALVSGIVASFLGGIPAVAIVCWAIAGPVVIGLLAVYLMKDVAGRAHLTYSPAVWGPTLYVVCLVVTFISVVIASLQIAFWVGRL